MISIYVKFHNSSDDDINLSGMTNKVAYARPFLKQISSNINEVIRAVLNSLFFLLKDFAHTKSTKSTKRHKDTRVNAQKCK